MSRRKKGREVNGWVVLDKPLGMTSTEAVARVKRLFQAAKAGHAGTLDPLATGSLPIALGEATKTVAHVMESRKAYVFTVAWGVETETDDAEGRPAATSDIRPSRDEVEAVLPRFVGVIEQVPPRYSAIKIAGARAYDLAREGETVELKARPVVIDSLALVEHGEGRSVLRAECGKGAYVRALARDIGRLLGCFGHVAALRRLSVGPFGEADLVSLRALEEAAPRETEEAAVPEPAGGRPGPESWLKPVETALAGLTSVAVPRDAALRLKRGQNVILRGRDAPAEGVAYATCGGLLVAVGHVERGEMVPHRIFNLGAL